MADHELVDRRWIAHYPDGLVHSQSAVFGMPLRRVEEGPPFVDDSQSIGLRPAEGALLYRRAFVQLPQPGGDRGNGGRRVRFPMRSDGIAGRTGRR